VGWPGMADVVAVGWASCFTVRWCSVSGGSDPC
jgi:hypothetical protein